jgi:predicted amidohydrolase
MFLTGYRTDKFNPLWAVELTDTDPTLRTISDIAARNGVQIMVGTATRADETPTGVHNTAVLISGDGLVGYYHKLHVARITVPSGEVVDENIWFSAGSEAPVWSTDFGVIGPQICYDSSFPELSRTQSMKGAEVLLNITASATGFESKWAHMRATRAFENAAWYVACSVVGTQNGDRFFGRSAVVNPFGETVVEALDGEEDLVFADIDPDETLLWRARMNTMPARRPDAYGDVMSQPTSQES